MYFEKKINQFNLLSYDNKVKRVLNLLFELKKDNNDIEYIYNKILTNKNIDVNIINDIYKTIMEAIVYQNSLDNKKNLDKISTIKNRLKSHLIDEEKERKEELEDLDKLINF